MTSNNQRELAKQLVKQGDPKIISSIINHSLQKKDINVQVTRDDDCLEVTLESDQIANQQASLVEFIRGGIVKLGVESINRVKVYGVQTDDQKPVWEEEFFLGTEPTSTSDFEEVSEAEDFSEPVDEDQVDDLDQELEADYETEIEEDYFEEGEYDEEGDYEENDDDQEEEELEEQPQKKKIPLIPAIFGILLALVAAVAAVHFSGIFPLPFLSQSKSENTEGDNSSTTTATPQDTQGGASPKSSESAAIEANPWYFAVRSAQTAAQKAQTAQTQSEWNAVVSEWQKAADLMGKVKNSDPNYQKAQEKIIEYQNNVNITKQRAENAPN
ncbi:MAG: hypothetical protein AB4080_00725 [Trichodesmium sp.]